MCDTTAYIIDNDTEQMIMESVQIIRPQDDGIYMKNLFGEEKVFKGRIKEITLGNGKVIIEP